MVKIGSIVITIVIQGVLGDISRCHPGWIYYNDACYFLSRDTETWVEAFSYCEIYDSQLVSIIDEDENNFLKTELRKRHAADSDWNVCYFTSGTDGPVEGHWEWTPSGDPLTYTNWGPKEPSNGGGMENCLCLYKAHDFSWNDRNCHNQDHFICKTRATFSSELIG
ncbi:C-type lectin lectoxin-Lio3-like [Pecten maximus]|uniref:C-type lectin lectoxin-Lio3-like n=1 Tax=Pecten maximus TaxID=6579 RepID=UPI001458BA7D|nr:C-type lectin lectoxin-Lio3-like [Pecten maximus]